MMLGTVRSETLYVYKKERRLFNVKYLTKNEVYCKLYMFSVCCCSMLITYKGVIDTVKRRKCRAVSLQPELQDLAWDPSWQGSDARASEEQIRSVYRGSAWFQIRPLYCRNISTQ